MNGVKEQSAHSNITSNMVNIFQKFFIIPMKHTSNMIVCIISDIYHITECSSLVLMTNKVN